MHFRRFSHMFIGFNTSCPLFGPLRTSKALMVQTIRPRMVGLTQMGMLWLEPSPKSIVLWLETVGLWHWVTTFTKPSNFQFSWHKQDEAHEPECSHVC